MRLPATPLHDLTRRLALYRVKRLGWFFAANITDVVAESLNFELFADFEEPNIEFHPTGCVGTIQVAIGCGPMEDDLRYDLLIRSSGSQFRYEFSGECLEANVTGTDKDSRQAICYAVADSIIRKLDPHRFGRRAFGAATGELRAASFERCLPVYWRAELDD